MYVAIACGKKKTALVNVSSFKLLCAHIIIIIRKPISFKPQKIERRKCNQLFDIFITVYRV
jgi:hypothetical protein